MPVTAVYIHIPYCKSKCAYCDFPSVPLDGSVQPYLRALAKEAANASGAVHVAETVYIGGGTPTVLTPDQICWLFERLRATLNISAHAEITVEANPNSLDPAKTRALTANGVNRVSVGAQSFVDAELSFLGRVHRARDIPRGVSLLREAGIRNVNLDLIYAISNQSRESWLYSLAQAIALKPEHISAYCLSFEQHTSLWRLLHEGRIEKKSDEEELELYEAARETLTDAGYEHYEISNFALPGKRSAHNTAYWANEEYLGLGAGAVSYMDGRRITNLRGVQEYILAMETRGSGACAVEKISPRMQAVETIIQRLRLREGIECSAFTDRFDLHPKDILDGSFDELVGLGMLEYTSDTIRSSLKGWHLANEVALKILP